MKLNFTEMPLNFVDIHFLIYNDQFKTKSEYISFRFMYLQIIHNMAVFYLHFEFSDYIISINFNKMEEKVPHLNVIEPLKMDVIEA